MKSKMKNRIIKIIGIVVVFIINFASTSALSQEHNLTFTHIDSMSFKKDQAYTKARIWISKSFTSAKAVIDMDDKESGRIIAKGLFTFPAKNLYGAVVGSEPIHFTTTIDVKDNKYRIVINDFYHTKGNYNGAAAGGSLNLDKPDCGFIKMQKKRWVAMQEASKELSLGMIDDFKNEMNDSKTNQDF